MSIVLQEALDSDVSIEVKVAFLKGGTLTNTTSYLFPTFAVSLEAKCASIKMFLLLIYCEFFQDP